MASMRIIHALLAGGAGLLALACNGVSGQEYPSRPIRIVTFLVGGPSDVQARFIAKGLESRLKQPVLIDTKLGAGGLLANREVARSRPDGYTLLFATAAFTGTLASYKDPQYRIEDFAYLAPVSISGQAMMVSAAVPSNTFAEFVAYARANPTALNYASLGVGTGLFAAERLKQAARIEMTEIPFKGAPQAQQELLVGRAHVYFSGVGNAKQGMEASNGRIRLLAVASPTRSKFLPDVPTFRELGLPSVQTATWNLMLGPAAMPAEVTKRLRDALAGVIGSREFEETLDKLSFEPWPLGLEQLDAFIKADVEQTRADIVRLKIPLM